MVSPYLRTRTTGMESMYVQLQGSSFTIKQTPSFPNGQTLQVYFSQVSCINSSAFRSSSQLRLLLVIFNILPFFVCSTIIYQSKIKVNILFYMFTRLRDKATVEKRKKEFQKTIDKSQNLMYNKYVRLREKITQSYRRGSSC